ncbi:Tfp pilus assembly protein FimV-like protein [Ectopseudomonas oleovorans]|uniref:Tfp pilus assembly protein FimV-like protein n=2 Tax=Gammaproteobacteria TaxID=1236 RepID=A0A379K851_ECTOL|nr:FimV/HubP family polar landmark protein [Pseudomonas oleovorans]SUD60539.1 Tfp pilus assembly protein FimV-like protein [Pseudomonas oleovorans]
MVRVRKLVLAIAAASALSSGMAHALGLGEVTLQSSLNQPLVAEIELLEVRDLASNEVIPSLASPEEFIKAGVDRQYFLTDLKFTPVLKPNGKSVIRITSSKTVREPYLNFLVEVLWPNGRLLREYTLLLDPPLYSPQTTVAAAPQLPIAAPAPRPSAAPASASAPRSSAPAPAPRPAAPAPASRAISGNEYRTTANDTLWEIAQRVGGGSVNQAMLAIQDLNPDAFIGGNINRMKSGQVLRLPDEQQIRSRSNAEAIAQVAEQNAAWREGRAVASRQLDATRRTTAGAAPATAEAGDSLKLVAAEAGQSTRGSDTGAAGSKALADKLAVTQESLDSTRRENAELQSRVSDLQSQLDKLQRLVELKDSQLAKLQADLSAAPAAPAATEEPPAETPAAAPEAAPPAVEAATPPTTPPEEAAPDYNYSEEPAAPVEDSAAATQQPASEPAAAVEPAAPVKPAEAVKPATPAPAPAPAPQSFIDDLLANPMTLGLAGGGALLLLLAGLMALSRRNAQKESELQDELADDLSQEQAFASDLDMPEDSFAGLDDEPVQTAQAAGEERVTAQTGDALGEADIYIAYGRFNQAAELLQNAINDEPHRADLRLKLMEVYAELGDREGFARQDNELREIGGVNAEAELLKSKYPAIAAFAGVGAAAAAASVDDDMGDFSLGDLSLDEPTAETPASTGADLDDAFDLSLDDLEADLESDVQSSKAEQAPLSLDDDLDFGLVDEPAAPAASADDDLGFDLALDDDKVELSQPTDDLSAFSLDLDEAAPAVSDEADDFLLSLDDDAPLNQPAEDLSDLSLDLAEEAPSANLDLPADFDLSLEDETPVQPAVASDSFAAQLDEVTAELDQLSADLEEPQAAPLAPASSLSSDLDGDDDFDFLSGTDETATKLDLARAYIDMGDTEGARDILEEVVAEGSDAQQQEAREMISKLV